MPDAYLALETGDVFTANARAPGRARGELVFTTAYTGYEESLTDPSYEAQVLTFAYPLIGNYGVRTERFESDDVHPSAVIAREITDDVATWLTEEGVPAIDGLDTRDVVLDVREEGAMKVGIAAGPDATPEAARSELADCPNMSDITDIGERVSVSDVETFDRSGSCCPEKGGVHTEESYHVALVDCGAKRSIVDSLTARGAKVTVLPHDTSPDTVDSLNPDVLFVSNGPGDPANFELTQNLVEAVAGDVPLAGICLGQQVIARALGGTTEKMAFGHRGANQPVLDHATGRVLMTTQNHSYAVADPGELDVTQTNVNDDTPEGLDSEELNVITRQYHPEANPGPHDTLEFFDDVLAMADTRCTPLAAD